MAGEDAGEEAKSITCKFFVQRKHRFCKAMPPEGKSYCVEHSHLESSSERKRIPCPLDPKHSVFEDRLEKHLGKCNARPKELAAYHVMNFNSGSSGVHSETTFEIDLKDIPTDELMNLTQKISSIYDGLDLKFEDYRGFCHRTVSEECSGEMGNTKRSRHLIQVGALLEMLSTQGLLTGDTAFVEFGAGRGQLAHWVQRSLPRDAASCFVLVDRASPRHKFDWKHKWGEGPKFHRLRIDIEHLDLSKVNMIPSDQRLVCISKHLCGDATDLTLRCVSNYNNALQDVGKRGQTCAASEPEDGCSSEKRICLASSNRQPLAGVLVALCCHHRCSWEQFCGREALLQLGVSPRDFHLLTRMATWATCGARETGEEEEEERGGPPVHPRFGSLSVADREKIGRKCKQLIDFGRMKFLQKQFPNVVLCHYVDQKESLENVAIFAYQ